MSNDPISTSSSDDDSRIAASRLDQEEWDERYETSGDRPDDDANVWSGQPNGSLVAEFSERGNGRRALDVGCGEGADAIWLDQQGWQVEAVDISTISIHRARKAAEHNQAAVDFTTKDILIDPPTADRYDLITISYPALRHFDADPIVDHLIAALRPGGELFVIGHVLDEKSIAQANEHGFDPNDYLMVDDIASRVGTRLQVDVNEKRPRPDPPAGSRHHDDHVFRARKPTVER